MYMLQVKQTKRPKAEKAKNGKSALLTQKGSDISIAQTALAQTTSKQLTRIQQSIDTGSWSQCLQKTAQTTATLAAERLLDCIDDIDPSHLPRVIESAFHISQTLSGMPTSTHLAISVGSKDLTRQELIDLLTGPKSKTNNKNTIYSKQDSERGAESIPGSRNSAKPAQGNTYDIPSAIHPHSNASQIIDC